MNKSDDEAIRAAVRDHYGSVATEASKTEKIESGGACCT
jgi:hypothetical protein